jgi:hypothetical protein
MAEVTLPTSVESWKDVDDRPMGFPDAVEKKPPAWNMRGIPLSI